MMIDLFWTEDGGKSGRFESKRPHGYYMRSLEEYINLRNVSSAGIDESDISSVALSAQFLLKELVEGLAVAFILLFADIIQAVL